MYNWVKKKDSKKEDERGDNRMKRQLTILIADGVEVNRASLQAIFSEEYNVLEAKNGTEVIQKLKKRDIDLVLLDLFLPGIDGVRALKKFKSEPVYRNIPVIVKTAVHGNMEEAILEAGADDFILLPCSPAVIKKRVKNVAQKCILECELFRSQIERARRLSKAKDEFAMELFECVCGTLENMIALSNVDPKEQAVGKMKGALRELNNKGRKLKSQIQNVQKMYGEEKAQGRRRESAFSIRRMADELRESPLRNKRGETAKLLFEEAEVAQEYLFGDRESIGQIWKNLLSAVCAAVSSEKTVKSVYQSYVSGEGTLMMEFSAEAECSLEIEEMPCLMIKNMAEILQGTFEKEQKTGTVFRVVLPVKKGKSPVSKRRELEAMKILSVGTEPVFQEYYAAIFRRLGICFDMAEKEEEAFELMEASYESGDSYDVCFINGQTGAQKAADFAAQVRERYDYDTTVTVCLSDGAETQGRDLNGFQADYVLKEPVFHSTIYQLLTNICQKV